MSMMPSSSNTDSNMMMTTSKLSFAEDGRGDKRRLRLKPMYVIGSYNGLNYDITEGRSGIVKVGEYAVIDGFPCRVTRIDYGPRGRMGHRKYQIYGFGILDNKKRSQLFGPNLQTIVPTIVQQHQSDINEEDDYANSSFIPEAPPGQSPPIMVCWQDEDYVPQNDGKYYIFTHTSVSWVVDNNSEEQQPLPSTTTTKTVWVLPKQEWYRPDGASYVDGYYTMTRCLKFLLKERDDFHLRERNKKSFFTFFKAATTTTGHDQEQQQQITSSSELSTTSSLLLLGKQEIPEVMDLIFDFVCGPPKYTTPEY